jgi:hypothetical protein
MIPELPTGAGMTEAEWLNTPDSQRMLTALSGFRASARKLRLFAVACCRRGWDNLRFAAHRRAVDIAERYADGEATDRELSRCRRAVERLYKELGDDDLDSHWSVLGATEFNLMDGAQQVRVIISPLRCEVLSDIFGNPFRAVTLDSRWRTTNVIDLARTIYEERAFDRLPILADALMDAGCANEDILEHCRGPGPHMRGCWVVDLLLEKS